VLLGSGKLATELDRLDLIDEYKLLVHPRIAPRVGRIAARVGGECHENDASDQANAGRPEERCGPAHLAP
jgi:hypothetical protein